MPNKVLQGTSEQRGFSEITLQPKSQVYQSSVLQIPLAPDYVASQDMLRVLIGCFFHMLIKKLKKVSFLLFFLFFFKSCKFQPIYIDNHLVLGKIIIDR